jgi:hypothetical protein
MRLFSFVACILALSFSACAQTSESAAPQATPPAAAPHPAAQTNTAEHHGPLYGNPNDRLFLPEGWIYGYGQFDFAPPHNEPDPNLCSPNSGDFGGKNSQCSAFSRYQLIGHFVFHPFGRTFLHLVKLEWDPNLNFGKNVPQTLYTWSWQWIGMEHSWVIGADLPKGFDFRVTQHFLFVRGNASAGPGYLGPNGPWGRYTTIGVRKVFGTYRDYYGAHPFQ